jgi:hypothetical protein
MIYVKLCIVRSGRFVYRHPGSISKVYMPKKVIVVSKINIQTKNSKVGYRPNRTKNGRKGGLDLRSDDGMEVIQTRWTVVNLLLHSPGIDLVITVSLGWTLIDISPQNMEWKKPTCLMPSSSTFSTPSRRIAVAVSSARTVEYQNLSVITSTHERSHNRKKRKHTLQNPLYTGRPSST